MMAEKHEPKLLNFRVKNESESEENTPKDSADGPYNQRLKRDSFHCT